MLKKKRLDCDEAMHECLHLDTRYLFKKLCK